MTGAFVSAREIARVLQDEADVTLVLPSDARISEEDLRDFKAVYRLSIRPLRRSLGGIILYLPYLLVAAIQLRILLSRNRIDVLFVNDFYLVQAAVAKLLGYRQAILTWVRIDPATFGWVAQFWLWAMKATSERIVSVSRYIQKVLPSKIGSVLLYDPVSAEFISAPEVSGANGKCFVYLGNYIFGKGQDVALEALSIVNKVCPEVTIYFYGGDMGLEKNKAYRQLLEKRAEELCVNSSVYFGDFIAAPRTVLSGKFAALNLSFSESFSRTVLEASASGLPVIASLCGGPEEIVVDKVTGILVPINDAQSCADAMVALCTRSGLARRMGQLGRARVLEVFSPHVFRTQLRALLPPVR